MALPKIEIFVEVYWEKRTYDLSEYRKDIECEYGGGWTIIKCPGFPEINGGYASPDFNETEESIKQMFIKRYTEWSNNTHEVIVHIKVTKDERAIRPNTLEAFF